MTRVVRLLLLYAHRKSSLHLWVFIGHRYARVGLRHLHVLPRQLQCALQLIIVLPVLWLLRSMLATMLAAVVVTAMVATGHRA